MECLKFLFGYGVLAVLLQTADSGLLPNGILISSAKKSNLNAALAMKTTHLFIVPVTPHQFVQNASLLSRTLSISYDKAPLTKYTNLDFDYLSEIIYFYDQPTANIVALNRFKSIQNFHQGVSRTMYTSLAVDWVSHNVYWIDNMLGWIAMQPGNPNANLNQYKIIIDNLQGPKAIAVAPNSGYLFFADGGKTSRIERASLTGEDRTVILSQNILNPLNIEVDVGASKIIWVDEQRDTIEMANFDGSKRTVIRRQPHTTFFDVAVYQDVLGVIDLSDGKLKFFNKTNGTPIGKAIESKTQDFFGVGFYTAENQPQQLNKCLMKRCSDMCINDNTQATCVCREGYRLKNNNLTCVGEMQEKFDAWIVLSRDSRSFSNLRPTTTGGEITKVNKAAFEDAGSHHRGVVLAFQNKYCILDIRSVTTTHYLPKTSCVETHKQILHMEIDSWTRKIVFASDDGIYESHIGQKSNPILLTAVNKQITGLALDWTKKNVYWSEGRENGSIQVISQQTNDLSTIHDRNLSYPRALIILLSHSKLVWISGDQDSSEILMSDMTGDNVFDIVQPEFLVYPQTIAVDSNEKILYWSDNGYIRFCQLDSTGVTPMILSLTEMPLYLTPYKGYFIYGTNSQEPTINIYSINTPYSLKNKIVAQGSPALKGLKVLDESHQPFIQNPCNILNGGCEHVCLFTNNEKICRCNFGFTLDFNGQTCSAESLADNFILVADWTHNEMYQVSMVTSDIRGVDVEDIDQPTAIAYNYKTREIIWSESKAGKIKKCFVNGLNYTNLLNTGTYGNFADRFAIDFTSGNIYYTFVNNTIWGMSGVGVLSPDGKHKQLITYTGTPRDIVVHPKQGLLFWTDHHLSFPFVKRANMDGTDIRTIVTANIKWPNGLAIDYTDHMLYLTDGLYNTIQRCTFDGDCEIIYTDPAAHLMDIDLLGDYLYFTAWNRPYIAKMHKANTSDFTKLIEQAELGRLDSISVYSSIETNNPVSEACLGKDGLGECSTFCLPTSTDFTCACEDGIKLLADGKTCENASNFSMTTTHIPTSDRTSLTTDAASVMHTKVDIDRTKSSTVSSTLHHPSKTEDTIDNISASSAVLSKLNASSAIPATIESLSSSSLKFGGLSSRIGERTTVIDGGNRTNVLMTTNSPNQVLSVTSTSDISWMVPVIVFTILILIGLLAVCIFKARKIRKVSFIPPSELIPYSRQDLSNPLYDNLLEDKNNL